MCLTTLQSRWPSPGHHVGISCLFRPILRIDGSASARTDAAHLQDSIFFDFDIMRHIRGLGVEAAGWQDLQVGRIEPFTIAGCVGPGENRDLTGVRMRMGRNPETLRETKSNGVRPWFGRIANEVELLQAWYRQPAL